MFFTDQHGALIVAHHRAGVRRARIARKIVDVCVSGCRQPDAVKTEYRFSRLPSLYLLRPQRIESLELLVTLADPVMVPVRRDRLPVLNARNGLCFA